MTTRQETPAADALATASPEALIDAVIRLTHAIHSDGMREGGTLRDRQSREAHTADLRAQRDLARAELLRRAGA
jgi:hypothetical protein